MLHNQMNSLVDKIQRHNEINASYRKPSEEKHIQNILYGIRWDMDYLVSQMQSEHDCKVTLTMPSNDNITIEDIDYPGMNILMQKMYM